MFTSRGFLGVPAALLVLALTGCGDQSSPVAPLFAHRPCTPDVEGECATNRAEDPYPDSAGVWAGGWTEAECKNPYDFGPDGDNDILVDECESKLASAFAPLLVYARDCNVESGGRLGGDYAFAVARNGEYKIRIVYLLSYYNDCGTPNQGYPCCGWFATAHSGDSEFIFIDAAYHSATNHWRATQIFLSAHCGDAAGGDCNWFSAASPDWGWVGKRLGAPVVWVAAGKHANYITKGACENGGFLTQDDCDYNDLTMRVPVAGIYGRNIGSRWSPFIDCTAPYYSSSLTDANTEECYWTSRAFRGWQTENIGTAPKAYSKILSDFAGI